MFFEVISVALAGGVPLRHAFGDIFACGRFEAHRWGKVRFRVSIEHIALSHSGSLGLGGQIRQGSKSGCPSPTRFVTPAKEPNVRAGKMTLSNSSRAKTVRYSRSAGTESMLRRYFRLNSTELLAALTLHSKPRMVLPTKSSLVESPPRSCTRGSHLKTAGEECASSKDFSVPRQRYRSNWTIFPK